MDIHKVNTVMNIKCNAGVTWTDTVGNLLGYGQVWFNKDGIANILSFLRVEERYRVTYNSAHSKKFIIHKGNGVVRRFKHSKGGLFCYLDAKEANTEVRTALVNTVEDNKTIYTINPGLQASYASQKIAVHNWATIGLYIPEHC
jgi:hypothetical protein